MAAPYPRDTVDALIAASEGRLTTRIAELEGRLTAKIVDLEGRMNAGFEALRGEVASIRGEWKVWMLVLGTVLAVLSSGVGHRLLNLVWPAGPNGAPGAGVPTLR